MRWKLQTIRFYHQPMTEIHWAIIFRVHQRSTPSESVSVGASFLVSPSQLCRMFGPSVATESFERPQQLVLSGPVRRHVALLLQQDAV